MKNVYFLFLFLSGLQGMAQQDSTRRLNAENFEKAITATDIQVLDVRTAAEYKTGHIKNALQADWTQQAQFTDRIQFVDKQKPVYIYCLVGGRSAAAADWMRKNGFEKVIELEGGTNAWKKAGKPLEGMETQPQLTMEQYLEKIPVDETVLVDFGAEWCPPCVKMKPLIDELEQKEHITVIRIDAGVHTNLVNELGIEPIPVFIVYKKGKEIWRKQGIVTKEELMKQLKKG